MTTKGGCGTVKQDRALLLCKMNGKVMSFFNKLFGKTKGPPDEGHDIDKAIALATSIASSIDGFIQVEGLSALETAAIRCDKNNRVWVTFGSGPSVHKPNKSGVVYLYNLPEFEQLRTGFKWSTPSPDYYQGMSAEQAKANSEIFASGRHRLVDELAWAVLRALESIPPP